MPREFNCPTIRLLTERSWILSCDSAVAVGLLIRHQFVGSREVRIPSCSVFGGVQEMCAKGELASQRARESFTAAFCKPSMRLSRFSMGASPRQSTELGAGMGDPAATFDTVCRAKCKFDTGVPLSMCLNSAGIPLSSLPRGQQRMQFCKK